jgi:hypothetical protein
MLLAAHSNRAASVYGKTLDRIWDRLHRKPDPPAGHRWNPNPFDGTPP